MDNNLDVVSVMISCHDGILERWDLRFDGIVPRWLYDNNYFQFSELLFSQISVVLKATSDHPVNGGSGIRSYGCIHIP